MIGIVLAVPMVVRVFALPAAARLADRRDALRAGMMIAPGTSVAGFGGAWRWPKGSSRSWPSLRSPPWYQRRSCCSRIAYALRGIAQWGRAYGPVRLWGSAAFVAATLASGYLLDAMGPRHLIWLLVAALRMTAVAAGLFAPLAANPVGPGGVRAPPEGFCAIGVLRGRGRSEPNPGRAMPSIMGSPPSTG